MKTGILIANEEEQLNRFRLSFTKYNFNSEELLLNCWRTGFENSTKITNYRFNNQLIGRLCGILM